MENPRHPLIYLNAHRCRLLPLLPLSFEPEHVLPLGHCRQVKARRLAAFAPRLTVIDSVVVLDRHRKRLYIAGCVVDQITFKVQPTVIEIRVRRNPDVAARLQREWFGEDGLSSLRIRDRLQRESLIEYFCPGTRCK